MADEAGSLAVERVFREEAGRIIATLIRVFGDFDVAEEAMQDAFAEALDHWPRQGVPDNPAAWITTAARRKGIDRSRRRQTRVQKQDEIAYQTPTAVAPQEFDEDAFHPLADDPLRLIFTCCHPALKLDAQVALTLRTLGGLTTPEIARAFLLPEPTLAQRLVRAKKRLRDANVPYQVPAPDELPARTPAVLAVLYLIFNEGYAATAGDALIRRELCAEAIRMAGIVAELMPHDPEVFGLLALLLLQDSRREARTDAAGELVTLDEQDRRRWDESQIGQGLAALDRAIRLRRPGPYQFQAAIAAVHSQARTPEETDWARIAALYERLYALSPSPVIRLNQAVAVAMADGPEAGLARMAELEEALGAYHLFYAARADFLRRLGRRDEAAAAYRRALDLAQNEPERRFLQKRLAEVS